MNCCLLTAVLLAVSAPPEYAIQSTPTSKVQGTLRAELAYGRGLSELAFVTPEPPKFPWQTEPAVASAEKPFEVKEDGPHGRKLLVFRRPVSIKAGSASVEVTYTAQLASRRLVKLAEGDTAPDVPDLSAADRKLFTAATDHYDFESEAFQKYLDEHELRRAEDGDEIAFARRVYDHIRDNYTYVFDPHADRRTSGLLEARKTDCAGVCFVLVSALRANGVPARSLYGRWTRSSRPDQTRDGQPYSQSHVKAEFFAQGVGWVPVEMSSAVEARGRRFSPDWFGLDRGDFLCIAADPAISVTAPKLGKVSVQHAQGPHYFYLGKVEADTLKYTTTWDVKRGE